MQEIRHHIKQTVETIAPLDRQEKEHISFVSNWIASGSDIFRIRKPSIPDPHLVCYFLLLDVKVNQLLLVDHKNAGLWLPAGGHVEMGEDPKETVRRECREELGIEANFLLDDPFFLTVAKVVGSHDSHTDVSLWYLLEGSHTDRIVFEEREFHKVQWFVPDAIPFDKADPHLGRCIQKLTLLNKINILL